MDGRIAVVTGAASGIGLAVVRRWLASGGSVVGLDLNGPALRSLEVEIGDRFRGAAVDVTSTLAIERAFAEAAALDGHIDAVVASAGVASSGPSAAVEDETFGRILDVHLGGTLRAARAAFPYLAAEGGALVTIGSVSARAGMPGRAAYSSAKAGIEGLTRTLAVEWAKAGIRVNCVHPGFVNTEFTRDQERQGNIDTSTILARTPLRRLAEPDEIAEAICFLASSAASYITGQALTVDGGLTVAGDFI